MRETTKVNRFSVAENDAMSQSHHSPKAKIAKPSQTSWVSALNLLQVQNGAKSRKRTALCHLSHNYNNLLINK